GDLVLRVDHAGRIGRVVEQEQLGLLRQRRVELRRGELVVLLRRARQQLDVGFQDLADVDIAGPVRRGEREAVARVEQRLAQVVQDVLGTDAGRAVGAGVAGQAYLPDVRQQGIEQFVGTAVAAVL